MSNAILSSVTGRLVSQHRGCILWPSPGRAWDLTSPWVYCGILRTTVSVGTHIALQFPDHAMVRVFQFQVVPEYFLRANLATAMRSGTRSIRSRRVGAVLRVSSFRRASRASDFLTVGHVFRVGGGRTKIIGCFTRKFVFSYRTIFCFPC
jgi:hypothetical protein